MALGQQAARRVGHDLAAVGVVAVDDELLGAALGAQAQRLVGEQLVVREAVVQLDHVDVLGADAGRLVDLLRGRAAPCRSRPPRIMSRGSKVARRVGGHRLRQDPHVACRRPCFLANASEQTIAAAAPQVGGQAIRRVITPGQITGDAHHLVFA